MAEADQQNEGNNQSNPVLESLQNDARIYGETIKEVANEIMSNEISNYPIFVAYQEEVDIGKPFISRDLYGTNWHINASMLEEFVKKGIVKQEKVDEFRNVYKDPQQYICFFVVTKEQGSFVFAPYPEEVTNANPN